MVHPSSSRRYIFYALVCFVLTLLWRSTRYRPHSSHQTLPKEGIRVPIKKQHGLPGNVSAAITRPTSNGHLDSLWRCRSTPNSHTGHARLFQNMVQNISGIPPFSRQPERRVFFNPTIIPLPYWSKNQYFVVSRVVTDGSHQENVLCEANTCYAGSADDARPGEKPCTEDDIVYLGPAGGLRCATAPVDVNVPPTPARYCGGDLAGFPDIPGFHDPRIFYSGRGEPLMIVNSHSQYACFGLWIIDLRSLYPPLATILSSSPKQLSLGPLRSYPHLTEITRNPPSTRGTVEKNWFIFYPPTGEAFIHYDISNPRNASRGRTFAKLIGSGLTTPNLTSPLETPCIHDDSIDAGSADEAGSNGTWHQATNSLRLVLCDRSDPRCEPGPGNTVFFALVHRKHANALRLPLRYERYFVVWASTAPYQLLGVSKHPMLLANETASGWSARQNWEDEDAGGRTVAGSGDATRRRREREEEAKGHWAYFTYTVSLAWAWRGNVEVQDLHEGYLDEEVVLGVGVDDAGTVMGRARARDLVGCLRACDGGAGTK